MLRHGGQDNFFSELSMFEFWQGHYVVFSGETHINSCGDLWRSLVISCSDLLISPPSLPNV